MSSLPELRTNSVEGDATEPPPGARGAIAGLAALGACAAAFVTVESMPIGLLPAIAASMHRSLSATGLLVTIYALVVVGATVPLTRLTAGLPQRALLAAVVAGLVLGSVGSAVAPDYALLLGSRVLTALAQAIFWGVAPVQAAGLVSAKSRGRAVSALFAGSSGGVVIGLPAGTWLGHAAGWRASFIGLATLAALLLAAILVVLPRRAGSLSRRHEAAARELGRYRAIVAAMALAVTAFYAAYTYVSPFLVRVSGVAHADVALALLVAGLASAIGLAVGGLIYARHPLGAIAGPLAVMVAALACLFAFAPQTAPAVAFVALDGLGLGMLVVAAQTAVLDLGPRNGTAWFSTAFNVGIASGPLVGALALQTSGLRATALAAAIVAAVALCVVLPRHAASGT
jgi:DHA1 family inner membrane transport protein